MQSHSGKLCRLSVRFKPLACAVLAACAWDGSSGRPVHAQFNEEVTGVESLCKVANPGYSPAQVKSSVVKPAPSVDLGTSAAGVYGRSPWSAISGDRDGFYEPLVNAGAY